MFWIALTAQISMPQMDRGSIWTLFSYDDVPLQLVPSGKVMRVGFRVTVERNGTIQSCRAESSSGDPKLDAYTCALVLRRARFRAATGFDGLPAYGVVRADVAWAVDAIPKWSPGDLQLTVSHLPKGFKSPAYIGLMFVVDETGRPSSCMEEDPKLPSQPKQAIELVQIACRELLKSYVAIPAMDDAGKPVPSIQNATVSFTVGGH
jgi:hypothetical protein